MKRQGGGSWTRGDLLWWGGVWGLVLLAGTGLYAAAFRMPNEGWEFSGFLLNSSDPWGYRGFARRFAAGGLLIDNPFAPAAAEPAFFNLLWLLVGKTQALLGAGFLPVYFALGIAASGLMYAALLAFAREFLGGGPRSRLAFLLAGLGTGFGWIPALVSDRLAFRLRSFDLYHHEGYPLLSALFFPHVALATALLVAALLWFHRGVSTGRRGWSAGSAGLLLVLAFIQPYHVVTVIGVATAWMAVEQAVDRRRLLPGWLDLALLAAAALPPAAYYRWLFRQPNWAVWSSSNVVRSTLPGFLLGVGPLLLLAAVGAWRGRADLSRKRMLLAWIGVGLGLVFSYPLFTFEAKFVMGLIVPLAVLGAGAFAGGGDGRSVRRWPAAVVLLLLLPSTAVLASRSLQVVAGRWRNLLTTEWTVGAFLYRGDAAVMRHLAENPLRGALLMVPNQEGRLLPAAADVRVFVSTPSLTPGFDWRNPLAEAVYSPSLSWQERSSLLKRAGVTHLWWSPVWDFGFTPDREPYLEPVFVDSGSGIWKIVP